MDKNASIVVTGAAGFIGSCLVGYLNEQGFDNLILVDEFSTHEKFPNLEHKRFKDKVERDVFFEWLFRHKPQIDFIFHIGARTDTTEFDYAVHQKLNVEYSQKLWNYCTVGNIPFVYASSAATYGAGEQGYDDDHNLSHRLKPLNPYGVSKNEFDKWVLHQGNHPPFWAGLKFFNVYGGFKILQQQPDIIRVLIHDATGRLVKDEIQQGLVMTITTFGMQRGLYFVTIIKEDKKVFKGKIVIGK